MAKRIETGKRKKVDPTTSGSEAKKQIQLLLNDPNISPTTKKKLREIHGSLDKQIEGIKTTDTVKRIGKPEYTDVSQIKPPRESGGVEWQKLNQHIHQLESSGDTNSPVYQKAIKNWERQTGDTYKSGQAKDELKQPEQSKTSVPGQHLSDEANAKRMARDESQRAVKDWMIGNKPEQVKELGGRKQMEADVELRSKKAGKLTGGVKRRMATGEDVAVRDKSFGRKLDEQRKIKQAEQKAQANTVTKETIRVPGAKPQATPDELAQIKAAIDHPDTPQEHKVSLQALYDSHLKNSGS